MSAEGSSWRLGRGAAEAAGDVMEVTLVHQSSLASPGGRTLHARRASCRDTSDTASPGPGSASVRRTGSLQVTTKIRDSFQRKGSSPS